MTVKEMIDILSEMPKDLKVILATQDDEAKIGVIKKISHDFRGSIFEKDFKNGIYEYVAIIEKKMM